ncbi:unnamed protein product [Soboliphyme baturini]|uniref:Integrase_SAM-like_N domain-containing protein n=1 Tax=Soboliphyme baturini TaxID=241478 RepID=A0A183J6G7_9BILA|nr:unnamed protein product [Soboliphyme baturini]
MRRQMEAQRETMREEIKINFDSVKVKCIEDYLEAIRALEKEYEEKIQKCSSFYTEQTKIEYENTIPHVSARTDAKKTKRKLIVTFRNFGWFLRHGERLIFPWTTVEQCHSLDALATSIYESQFIPSKVLNASRP